MKFCWSTISVRNMDESIKFYQEIVGLQVNRRFSAGHSGEIAFLGDGETKIELIQYENREDIIFGQDISWGFEVESLDVHIALLKEKGIPIHSGPIQPNAHTKFLYVLDPNGLKIQFVEII